MAKPYVVAAAPWKATKNGFFHWLLPMDIVDGLSPCLETLSDMIDMVFLFEY